MAMCRRCPVTLSVLMLTVVPVANAATSTCGAVKASYKTQACCGKPEQTYTYDLPPTPAPPPPPKYLCANAEPQAPRDLTTGAQGDKTPKAATLNKAQAELLPLVNVHYHLGAEHKSDSYNADNDFKAWDVKHSKGRRLAADPRPGYMCPEDNLTTVQKAKYEFKHCKGTVTVGKSYEVHYVHSSAGYGKEDVKGVGIDGVDDGLGGAAGGRGLLNPMIVVQSQVFHIVQGSENLDAKNIHQGWSVVDHNNTVMYPGSTTGTSHNNEVCSPYTITWHTDKDCHRITPESFDNLCKLMKDTWNLDLDLYPHNSRVIVDKKYVVDSKYVLPFE